MLRDDAIRAGKIEPTREEREKFGFPTIKPGPKPKEKQKGTGEGRRIKPDDN